MTLHPIKAEWKYLLYFFFSNMSLSVLLKGMKVIFGHSELMSSVPLLFCQMFFMIETKCFSVLPSAILSI